MFKGANHVRTPVIDALRRPEDKRRLDIPDVQQGKILADPLRHDR